MTAATGVVVGLLGFAAGPSLAAWACRTQHRADPRAPVVAVTGASTALGAGFGARYAGDWELPAYVVLVAGSIVVTVVDLAEHRLPNRVLTPTAVVVVALLTGGAVLAGEAGAALRSLVWGAVAGAAFLLLHLASPRGLGMGDVKFSAVLGFAVGAQGAEAVFVALLLSFGLGAAAALVLLVTGRARRRDALPFGPFLASGSLIALLLHGGG